MIKYCLFCKEPYNAKSNYQKCCDRKECIEARRQDKLDKNKKAMFKFRNKNEIANKKADDNKTGLINDAKTAKELGISYGQLKLKEEMGLL